MATLKKKLDLYDKAIGLDVEINATQDLALDSLDQDLKVMSGTEVLAANIRRRLTTPIYGYAKLVRTATGYQYVDLDYGSGFSKYLSQPLTDSYVSETLSIIEQTVSQESRVAMVQANLMANSLNFYEVELVYAPNTPDVLNTQDIATGTFEDYSVFSDQVAANYSLLLPLYNSY